MGAFFVCKNARLNGPNCATMLVACLFARCSLKHAPIFCMNVNTLEPLVWQLCRHAIIDEGFFVGLSHQMKPLLLTF